MSGTPSLGTCTLSFTMTRPTSTSSDFLSSETEPCHDPQQVSIGYLVDPTTFTENVRCFWLGMWTAWICTVLLASVLGQVDVAVCREKNNVDPKTSASRSEFSSSRGHTRPPRLSFALVVVLTMNARRFQRTHCLSGSGSSLNASKDIGMEISDIMPISEPVIDAGYASVVGSPCLCVFEVIARTDLPTYATLATHNGHSF